MAGIEDLDEQVDALHGLPLDQFTGARDQLTRRLREAGEREAAAAVKQLRRPTLVAWSLNRVRRQSPESVQALLAAGDELRRAQQRLLAGGEHGALREAVARERSAVEVVARLARHELAEAGHAAGPAAETKLWQTLQASARDESTRELLAAGRLLRETEISDLGLGGGLADGAPAEPAVSRDRGTSGTASRARGRPAADALRPRIDPALTRQTDAAARRLEAARERQREREKDLAATKRAAAAAREDAERAAQVAARAEHKAEQAAQVAARAEHKDEQAEAQARRAAERSRELEDALAELRSGED